MKKIMAVIFSVAVFLFGCSAYLDDLFPAPQSDTDTLAFGLNTFGFDLYKQLQDTNFKNNNFVVSPHSISNCLAMVYTGARNTTAQQMSKVLDYTLTQAELPAAFGDLNSGLVSGNNIASTQDYDLALKIANSGWFQKNYSFLPAYIDTLTTGYGANVSTVDFINNFEGSRVLINQWAAAATGGEIPELIPEGVIDKFTRLVVVNAIYFKGTWEYPFDKNLTQDSPFYLLDGSTTDVPMMSGGGMLQYLEESAYQAVMLPYTQQGSLAMAIILPGKGLFKQVEQEITGGGLYSIIHHMKACQVSVKLPKFYTRNNLNLIDAFKAMGMTDVFSPETADLSGIDGGNAQPLYVSFIIHEAIIDVDEHGTEAAAGTAAGISTTVVPAEQVKFVADHPFIYAIFDRNTDAVLFLGRVLKPELKQ